MSSNTKPWLRLWKLLKWSVLSLTGLSLALVLFLLVWIDPNDYRDDITTLVKDETGLILKIDGNIAWNFYPALGFSVEGLSLAVTEGESPLAGVGKVVVSVELLPLFSKQVHVRTLYIDRASANLVVNPEGKGNWEALTTGSDETTADTGATEAATDDGEPLLVSVPKIVITNSVFEYEDQATNAHIMFLLKELVVEDVALDKEFPLQLVAKISTNNHIDVDFDLRTFIALDLDNEQYDVRALELKAAIAGVLEKPFNIELGTDVQANLKTQQVAVSRLEFKADSVSLPDMQSFGASLAGPVAVNLAADSARVGPIRFEALGVIGTLALDVEQLSGELAWNGSLDVQPFNAKNLMRTLGMTAPVTSDPMAMTKVALKTNLDGTLTRAMLEKLDLSLDDSLLRGRAGITDLDSTALVFDLTLDSINADRYLPPSTPTTATAATPAPAAADNEPLLPVESLRTLNIDGKFAAGKVVLTGLPMTQIAATVKAKDGDIRLDPFTAGVMDGTIRGDVRVDARGAQPHIVTHLAVDRVEVGGLVKHFTGKELFLGKTALKLDLDTHGNDVDTLMKKAVGSLDLGFTDAVLKGMNITNELNDVLTQQLGAFSMLIPDYQQKLPKEMGQDTLFKALNAKAKIADGIAEVPALNAAVKDGGIRGNGQLNIISMDFDYNLAMTSSKLDDNKYFAGAEFPVRCKGNINGAPASWCKPDGKAIGDMLKKAAGRAAKDRLQTEVANKLGIDVGGGSKQEVKEAVKDTVKEESKKKAQEELNKQLEKAMKKFF